MAKVQTKFQKITSFGGFYVMCKKNNLSIFLIREMCQRRAERANLLKLFFTHY